MDKRNQSHWNMQNRVVKIGTDYTAELTPTPGLMPAFIQLGTLNNDINNQDVFLKTSTKGVTAVKNNARTALYTFVLPVLRAGKAFARAQKNTELINKLNYRDADLLHLSDLEFSNTCAYLHDTLLPFVTQLTPYGVTEAMLTAIEADVKSFNILTTGLAETRAKRLVAQKAMAYDFSVCVELFANTLDPLMEVVKATKPDIYTEYMKTRHIGYPATDTISLVVHVELAGTHSPVAHVNLTLMPADEVTQQALAKGGASLVKHVKRTSAQGNSRYKNVVQGKYLVQAQKFGYQIATQEVYVNNTEVTNVTLVLIPLTQITH